MRRVLTLTVILAVAFVSQARASIEFKFSGVIGGVVDPGGLLDGSVNAGTVVTGFFRFDPNAVDGSPDDPVFGHYELPFDSLLQFSMGNYSITSGYEITVVNGFNPSLDNPFGSDQYALSATYSALGPVITNGIDIFSGSDVNLLGMSLSNYGGTAFDSDELPLSPPDLSQFGSRSLFIAFDDDSGIGQTTIQVDLNSLTNAEVPEPASLIVWSLLGVVVAGIARRRSRRALLA